MFLKKLAALVTAVFGFAASLVIVYAGDDSIAGPVMWLLIGSGVLIVAVVVLGILGKKIRKETNKRSDAKHRSFLFEKGNYRSIEFAVRISFSSGV